MASIFRFNYFYFNEDMPGYAEVLKNKASPLDGDGCDFAHGCVGWAMTDVLTNVNRGRFQHYADNVFISLQNIIEGSLTLGHLSEENNQNVEQLSHPNEEDAFPPYTWNEIAMQLNRYTESHPINDGFSPELFGAIGVRSNHFLQIQND